MTVKLSRWCARATRWRSGSITDIVHAVNADELKHSGYKVLDYVSASLRFRNRVNNVEITCTYMLE